MRLRARIALAIALASLVIVSALAFTIHEIASAATHHHLRHNLGHLAAGLRDRLDAGLYERLQDLRIWADLQGGRAAQVPVPRLRETLERLQRSHPEYAWIAFTDGRGRVLAATGGHLEGADVSDQRWWLAARLGEFVGDVHAFPALGQALRPAGGERLRFVDIALPVVQDGVTVGIVGAQLGWNWAGSLGRTVLDAVGSHPGAELLVVSAAGKVLMGPAGLEGVPVAADLAAGRIDHGLGEHLWPDGRPWVAAATASRAQPPVSALGWRVVARQPSELAYARLTRLRNVLIAGSLAAVVIASLVAYLLASRLARPLERWAEAADRIGAGEREVQFPDFAGPWELRRLSAALRSMSVQLNAKEDALQARISERTAALVEAVSALESERERLAYALEGSRLAMWDLDVVENEITLSSQWARMLGEPEAAETITTPIALLERVPPEEHAAIQAAMTAVLRGGATHYDVEHRVRCADGGYLWIRSRGRVTRRNERGQALRLNGTNADISARKQLELDLEGQAFTDPVTLLPNRRVLVDRLGRAVANARRVGSRCALLYLDLDGFKPVNDTLGHDAGDELLRRVGERVAGCLREADTVARVGGDEFAVLLADTGGAADVELVASKVLAAIGKPYALSGGPANVTASVGFAIFPDDASEADALMKAADAAMYRAKSRGKNRLAPAGA